MEMFKLLMRAEAAEIKVKALEDQVSFIPKIHSTDFFIVD